MKVIFNSDEVQKIVKNHVLANYTLPKNAKVADTSCPYGDYEVRIEETEDENAE